ncbi:hypothetical protein NGH33_10370, partial [Micrococcus yunnanensis]|nr:hypothetical protein [Micrococcus yunnanensis]
HPLTPFYSLHHHTVGLESDINAQLPGDPPPQCVTAAMGVIPSDTREVDQVEQTVGPAVERLAYAALPDGVRASAVVTDPTTGEILAMASKPGFDAMARISPVVGSVTSI